MDYSFDNGKISPRLRHLLVLSIVLILVGAVYAKVTNAYFCSYDDFFEVHRAAFEDTRDPWRILTTPQFDTYRYRPLSRGLNFLTYRVGDQNPLFFRARNLLFHLVNLLLVYLLAWKLFGSLQISAVAAALFGLHPIANQSVIGAVHTNTIAHTAFLAALLMVMQSVESGRHWRLWLTAGVLTGGLSFLAYEPNIVVFGLMFFWLIVGSMGGRKHPIDFRLPGVFLALSGIGFASYFTLRHLYVPSGWTRALSNVPSVTVVVKNSLMYLGAMLSPVDSVFANELLNTPLPSEIRFDTPWAIGFGAFLSLLGLVVALLVLRWLRSNKRTIAPGAVLFLLLGMTLPLSTMLLFEAHPAETYLYLPVAFYAVLLSYGLAKVLGEAKEVKTRKLYFPLVVVLVLLFAGATWVRNRRVFNCGETARRILAGLPKERFRDGRRNVLFANVPGGDSTRRYGFYGFRGVHTIADGEGADKAISSALQLVYRSTLLTGEILNLQQLSARCGGTGRASEICVLVHSDGRIEYWLPNL